MLRTNYKLTYNYNFVNPHNIGGILHNVRRIAEAGWLYNIPRSGLQPVNLDDIAFAILVHYVSNKLKQKL